jgi:hypothetical protein
MGEYTWRGALRDDGNAVFGNSVSAWICFQADAGRVAVVYSTYVGGKYAAVLAGAAVDSAGSVWVVGSTMGNGFPATPGAAQHANGSQQIYSAWVLGNQGMDGIELRGTAGILAKLQGDGTLEYASQTPPAERVA